MRQAKLHRKTNETNITVDINIDGSGIYNINTGIGFLDHMLSQLSKHSLIDIDIEAKGDLHIDQHHTTEDIAIVLGQAMSQALGDRKGIARYGHAIITMDDVLTQVAVDLATRPYIVWNVDFTVEKIGNMDTELFREWFIAFTNNLNCNIHVNNVYGINNHHICESSFKALAKSLRMAKQIDPELLSQSPSTKGIL